MNSFHSSNPHMNLLQEVDKLKDEQSQIRADTERIERDQMELAPALVDALQQMERLETECKRLKQKLDLRDPPKREASHEFMDYYLVLASTMDQVLENQQEMKKRLEKIEEQMNKLVHVLSGDTSKKRKSCYTHPVVSHTRITNPP